jgi:phospholipid-binding lipoprotein MlaA
MLPLLGPSTVRDTVALPADIAGDIWRYKDPTNVRNIGTVLRVVDQRANLLDASSLLEDAALDRYEFIRDGYMQRRESQIHPDGNPRSKAEKDEAAPADVKPTPVAAESSAPVSSESAPKELNSGTPAANNVSL